MASEAATTKMITGEEFRLLAIEEAGKNNFLFPNEASIRDTEMEKYDKEKKIQYENTRLP